MSMVEPMSREGSATPLWDAAVLSELASLSYVHAVVLTSGQGRVLHVAGGTKPPHGVGKAADLAQGALSQFGAQLGMDGLQLMASVFDEGVVALSRLNGVHVVVLAGPGANLGTLLNYLRRVGPREVTS